MIAKDRELYLATRQKKLGGVCSGLANFLDIPAFWVRIFSVFVLIIEPVPTLIGYGIAFWVLKSKSLEKIDQVSDLDQE